MKKHYFYYVMLILIASCKPADKVASNDAEKVGLMKKSITDFSDTATEYRSYPAVVQFFDPNTIEESPRILIERKKVFISSSGLPNETNIYQWKQNYTIEDAVNLYTKFKERNFNSPDITVFKQFASWLILTRLDLLSRTSVKDLNYIAMLVADLVETKYEGYQLLYYSLQHLERNHYTKHNENAQMACAILEYGNQEYNRVAVVQQNAPTTGKQKPLPKVVTDRIIAYNSSRTKMKSEMLQKIAKLK